MCKTCDNGSECRDCKIKHRKTPDCKDCLDNFGYYKGVCIKCDSDNQHKISVDGEIYE